MHHVKEEQKPTPSASGIVNDRLRQQRVIPESRRADGSIRKERKVKPGFTPAEDIGKFRPSRVLKAEAEARKSAEKQSTPGYVSPNVEAARRALASASISEVSQSPLPSSSSSSSLQAPLSGSPSSSAASAVKTSWRSKASTTKHPEPQASGTRDSEGSWRRGNGSIRTKENHVEIPEDWDQDDGNGASQNLVNGEEALSSQSQEEEEGRKKSIEAQSPALKGATNHPFRSPTKGNTDEGEQSKFSASSGAKRKQQPSLEHVLDQLNNLSVDEGT